MTQTLCNKNHKVVGDFGCQLCWQQFMKNENDISSREDCMKINFIKPEIPKEKKIKI